MVLNIPPPADNSRKAAQALFAWPGAREDLLSIRECLLTELPPRYSRPIELHACTRLEIEYRETLVSDLIEWCKKYVYIPAPSVDASRAPITADMPFMNPEDPNYAPELAAAVDLWLKLFRGAADRKSLKLRYQVHKLHPDLGSQAARRVATILGRPKPKKNQS